MFHFSGIDNMSDLKTILKQIKALPKFSKVGLGKIDRELISKMFIRFRTLEILTGELNKKVADGILAKVPTQQDLLSLKPLIIDGEEYSTETMVRAAFALAASERNEYVDCLVDVLILYRVSQAVLFTDIDDKSTLEFLSRIPSIDEAREFRRSILPRGCTVYFMSNRIMVLVSKGEGDADEDQNYFITAVDLGTFFQYIVRDGEAIPEKVDGAVMGRFRRSYFTGRPRFVNTRLVLWEEVAEPARYYWFVSGVNTKRPNYTYEIEFKQVAGRKAYSLKGNEWAQLKRVFGVPMTLTGMQPIEFKQFEEAAVA